MPAEKNSAISDAPATAAERLDDRLDHIEGLVAALSAEIDLLRAERAEWDGATDEERRGRPSTEELRADAKGEQTDADLGRAAALQLVAEGLDRDAVTAELKRLGMADPEPIVREAFRSEDPAAQAG
jgi:hypothetical protein